MIKNQKTFDQKNKIIKSFCVVGLNSDQLHYYNDKERPQLYINNIDILVAKISTHKNIYKRGDEIWYRVMENSDTWFRIHYKEKYNNPITDFKIIGCNIDETGNYLMIDKKYSHYSVIKVTYINDKEKPENDKNLINILDEYRPNNLDDNLNKIPKIYNIKEIMNLKSLNTPAAVIIITREKCFLPLKKIQIKILKDNQYQFRRNHYTSPFLVRYNPEILDQYPKNDNVNNSVSMFCFPEGIYFLEKPLPPSKFNFVLTDESGERTYCSVLIFWEKLNDETRKLLEPTFIEEIEKTEEEIKKHIYKNKKKLKEYFVPKALCVLARFPFFSNNIIFLKNLYKIFTSSSTSIPLERAISGYVDSLYKRSYDELIRFTILNDNIDFYFIPNYGKEWDINDHYLETLFRVLSIDIILVAWQGLLLEKKLYLICSSKETLLQVAHGLITLLFPFKWIHTYIPILPEKLRSFTESPMPLIFGIPFPIDINEIPDDGLSLIINVNKNCFENYRQEIPKFTGKLKMVLEKKIKNLKEKYNIEKPERTDEWMDYLDSLEPKEKPHNFVDIDGAEIRQVFYDVFFQMFKNYSKYFNWNIDNDSDKNDEDDIYEEDVEFKREVFLKDHGSNDEGTFLSMFCDTVIFGQFIKSLSVNETDGATRFFFESIKKGKDKNKLVLLNISPKNIVMAPKIKIDDLKGKEFFYPKFPKLDPNLTMKYEAPIKPYKSKFIFQKDEWCYEPTKLKKSDWPRYFLYLIYEIWYQFFSFSIHFYEKAKIEQLMDFSVFLLEDLIKKKKIIPTRNLFSKMFKACGRNELSSYLKQILTLANKLYKKSGTSIFQNAYLNGLYTIVDSGTSTNSNLSLSYSVLGDNNIKRNILDEIASHNIDYYSYFDNYLFLTEKYCPFCTKNIEKIKFISMEELLAGFNQNINKLDSICPNCLTVISSDVYYLNKNSKDASIQKFQLLAPTRLMIEIDEMIRIYGEYFFYLENLSDNNKVILLYLNTIFYFKLFDLPLFVLCIERDKTKFQENILKEIQENIHRKNILKEKRSKSPDKKRTREKTPEKSLSDVGSTTDDNTTIVSTKSNSSVGRSNIEYELWKDLYLKNKDKIKLTGDKIGTENKSDLSKRIKYMKLVLTDITSYFVNSYKEKLKEYLENLECKNEIKEDEKEKDKSENPFKSIHHNRPQSVDKTKYQGLSSEDYFKNNNNLNNNKYYNNYRSSAFDAIIKENEKEEENIINRQTEKINIPEGFNQINQLNDPNAKSSKGLRDKIKSIFSK